MTTVNNLIAHVEQLAGHPLNNDEWLFNGDRDRRINGVTVCWVASPGAIRAAGEAGHELLIGHESLFFPYNAPKASNLPQGWEMWHTNRQRRELLEAYGSTFLRVHGSADEICIFDDFADLLELGEPVVSEGFVKIFEIPPTPLADLVAHVKTCLAMPAVRVSTTEGMDQIVHRIGLPWGGLGLFVNVGYQQSLIEQDCDVFIAGETDNYGFRFSREVGIPMIETSHELSENPGLRRFTG
ncbi:MAG: Nif3-like dinuclear metal center hexameric protein, partial [Anaerolineae bacterium]|nr:Nif3-like dinuclear metal center hexameric protein [Anaerolineae bacterium]